MGRNTQKGVRRQHVLTVVVLCLSLVWASPCLDQATSQALRSVEGSGRVRVVVPSSMDLDSTIVERVLEAATPQPPLRGFPTDILAEFGVTVSLVEEGREGYEAWTFPVQSVVVIALGDAALWDTAKMRRVIRHELVHVGLYRFLGGRKVPIWFHEGFAEWAAGGLDCIGQVRLGLNVLARHTGGRVLGQLEHPNGISRGAYDLFASFFDFVDVRYPGLLEDGTLLTAVREEGVRSALEHTFGRTLEELEREWQHHLFAVYVGRPIPRCGGGATPNPRKRGHLTERPPLMRLDLLRFHGRLVVGNGLFSAPSEAAEALRPRLPTLWPGGPVKTDLFRGPETRPLP